MTTATKRRNKISRTEFSRLLKQKRISQKKLHEELEARSVYRNKMTVNRWCAGTHKCRDLYVCKHLSEILGVELMDIINCFK